jgi:hypothetical protein
MFTFFLKMEGNREKAGRQEKTTSEAHVFPWGLKTRFDVFGSLMF